MSRRPPAAARGFTLLELLIAMALFAVLGIAVVSLLGQGMSIFRAGTADTRTSDRLQASLPPVVSDLAAAQPAQPPEVFPPPPPDDETPPEPGTDVVPAAPAVRLRAGRVKLAELDESWGTFAYVALVRTNARESEDPILRQAGSVPVTPGVPVRVYEPATVDALAGTKTVTAVVAPGGLVEVVWIAIPEDPDPARRALATGPVVAGPDWPRGILTLYRLFRAPPGGPKSLLDPRNFDSIAKIRAAGRVMTEGVLSFEVTFRNVFAKSWADGTGGGRVEDGQAYVGSVWDSTRALDKDFPLHRGAASLADVRDDVFPAFARVQLTLAEEGEFGFGRGDAFLAEGISEQEKNLVLSSVDPLLTPGFSERWLKLDGEWCSTSWEQIDPLAKKLVVARGRRGTRAVAHDAGAPVHVGASVATDVPMVPKDRYVPK